MTSAAGAIKKHLVLTLICAVFFIGGLLRLNDLSAYTPDSCRYLIWGNSLAHGQGYLDPTQPEPDKFVVHAPLYALLIAPVEIIFPMSLIAVKVWTLLWGVLALVLFYYWISRAFGQAAAVLATLVLAMNPAMMFYSTEVLSEAPFIACILLAFVLLERMTAHEGVKRVPWGFLLLVSVLPLLRETGVALVLAVVLVLLSKKERKQALLAFAWFALVSGLWYVRNQILVSPNSASQIPNIALIRQHFVTPADSSFLNEIALRVWISLKAYAGQIAGLFFYPLFTRQLTDLIVEPSGAYKLAAAFLGVGKYLVLLITLPVIGAGVAADLRSSPTSSERGLFAVLYIAAICAYPVHDVRFLIPLCPLAYYYGVSGCRVILNGDRTPAFLRRGPAIAIGLLLLLVPNAIAIQQLVRTNLEYRNSPDGVFGHATVPAMFRFQWSKLKSWIDGNLPETAVIGTPIKDLVIVASPRKVLEIDPGETLPVFESLLRNNHVEYLLAPSEWRDIRQYEFLMRESRRFWFEPVTAAPNLMRVHSRFLEPDIASPAHQVFDTSSVTELLRMGRSELVKGHYPEANALLRRALELAPGVGDVLYQVMVSDLFLIDSAGAQSVYRLLMSQPQAYSYVKLAAAQFEAARFLSNVRASGMFEEQAVKTYKAASIYWNTGYYHRAQELMKTLMMTDTSYFVGLLWGFHYDLQLGDTVMAQRYLSILARIDSSNAVVVQFEHLLAIGDSLNAAHSAEERSALHLSAARIFQTVQLSDETIDQAEMALHERGDNADALLLIARMFELRGRTARSVELYEEVLRHDSQNRLARAKLDSLRAPLARR